MITYTLFKDLIGEYLRTNKNVNNDTLHDYLVNLVLPNEYHNCNLNKVKGDIFEYITKYYYISLGRETYLYNEIPIALKEILALGDRDKGIDLIYKFNDDWYGVQCKWRSNINECIDKNLVAGFKEELSRTKLNYGVMFTNVKQITRYFVNSGLKWVIKNTLDNDINENFINNMIVENVIVKKQVNKIQQLRYYQNDAIKALLDSKDKNKQCIMFCGTGKSIVMIEYIKQKKAGRVLILMPSLHLISQFYKNLNANYPGKKILCICSQFDAETLTCNEEKDDAKAKEILNEFVALDTDVKYTTDDDVINKHKGVKNLIILSTYQSSKLLKLHKFDVGIFDEAHKTVNNDKFGFCLNDTNCVIGERVYFTATPRYYKGNNDACVSMNNESIYGKEIFNYTYKQARDDNNVLDFRVISYIVPECLGNIVDEKYIEKDGLNVESEILISALQLAKHIKNNNESKKILTYHNTVRDAIDYKKTLNYIFGLYGIEAKIFHMSGKDNMVKRGKIFDEFERADIGVICSSRVLNEGVDIPCVDTIMFVDNRTSTIDITQCIGRGMRLYKDQKLCNVIIPIHYNNLEGKHNYSEIVRILIAMSSFDDKLIEYFVLKDVRNRIIVKSMDVVDICVGKVPMVGIGFNKIMEGLNVAISGSNVLGFDYNFSLLLEFVEVYGRIPKENEIYKGKKNLKSWFGHKKKTICSVNDELYKKMSINLIIKKKLDKYLNFKKTRLSWDKNFELLVKYCVINGCVPKYKEIYEGYPIYTWYGSQKTTIKNENCDLYKKMTTNSVIKLDIDKNLRNRENNINIQKLSWVEGSKLLIKYCEETGSMPIYNTIYEKKPLGSWITSQKTTINDINNPKYIHLSTNPIIKEHLDKFLINKEKNKNKIKMSWDESFKMLNEFCNEHSRMPTSNEIKLYEWVAEQKRRIDNKDNKKYIKMSTNSIIKNNLDEFLSTKENNKLKIKLSWEDNFKLIDEYCNENGCIPSIKINKGLNYWYNDQKGKIENTNDKLYIDMSSNLIIKKDLDKFLVNKQICQNKMIYQNKLANNK